MTVRTQDVERIARLAALALDEDSLAQLTGQISRILDYVSQLESVDPGEDAPAFSPHPGPWQPLRPDRARPFPFAVSLPEIAPDLRDGLFVVPRLSGVGDDAGDPPADS